MKNKFEDLYVWMESKELFLKLYYELSKSKEYFFKDQILRACLSISNNIAEGFERGTNKEFKYFLFVAKGSCGEVRSMLYIAKDLGFIQEGKVEKYLENIFKISSGLQKIIGKL